MMILIPISVLDFDLDGCGCRGMVNLWCGTDDVGSEVEVFR